MKLKYLLYCLFIIVLFSNCKSKKKLTQVPKVTEKVVTKKTPLKNIETKKAEISIKDATVSYIQKYKHTAIDEMRKYKIPASITLAQGILESSSGNSLLTKKSKNHFGIKCHKGWKGERVYHDDDEKGECFRVYKDPNKSFRDHSLFLAFRTRYSKLFKLKKGDYVRWAKGLSEAGYATDRRYPAKLIALIEKYDLHRFDTLVLSESVEKEEVIIVSKKEKHTVSKGDTLYNISKRYGLTVNELKQINGLTSNSINIGQVLEVVPNKNSNAGQASDVIFNKDNHTVGRGDTLYNISKRYGLTVEKLKQINSLTSNIINIGQVLSVVK